MTPPPPLRLAWTVWGLDALLYLFAFYQRVARLSLNVERAWQKAKRTFRSVVQVTERTIDKKGQRLLRTASP